jgi:hypothetical protein
LGNRIREINLFIAIFLSLFLLTLSLSSLLINFNVSISTYIILILVFATSLVLSNKVNRSSALILLLITATIFHLTSFYLLLPVGWSADQRTYFLSSLKDSGRIEALEEFSYEGLYYTRYPIAWLIASTIDMVSAVGTQASWLITISTAYVCFIIFLISIGRILGEKNSLNEVAWITTLIVITVYLHRPFLDLIPSSIGTLSLTMVLYLFLSRKRFAPLLLILMIPLLIAHGLSIYLTTASLFLVVASFIIAHVQRGEIRRAINFAIMIFAGTWFYQVGVQLIDSVIGEVPYRFEQILSTLTSGLLERPPTSSVEEQYLRVVYGFDFAVTVLAYAFPAFLTAVSILFYVYKFIKSPDNRHAMLMFFSIFIMICFLVSGYFGWKGIENYVARYLYVYTSPISVVVSATMLNFIFEDERHRLLKVVISAPLIIIGIISLTENFFTPYASILHTPDSWKFEKLYRNFYAPSEFNGNLANKLFPIGIINALSRREAHLIPLHANLNIQHPIIYSIGSVIFYVD